jgi:hypothetical protein
VNKLAPQFDGFSLVHLAFGAWAASHGVTFRDLLIVHTAWEVIEAFFIERYFGTPVTFRPEPLGDRIGDTISAAAGWALVRSVDETGQTTRAIHAPDLREHRQEEARPYPKGS